MFKKRMGSLLLSAVLAAGLLHTAAGPAAAQETGAGPVLPAELQTVMEEEGFTGLSPDLAEDLSSIVFEKADGSRTLYMYDQPVKYRDAGGEVRFKTKKAKKTEKKNGEGRAVYAFENPDNDWKAYLPARIADGVMLEAGGYRLEIFPEAEKNSKVKQTGGEEAPVLEYKQAFGKDTHLQYAYMGQGLKENILLERYTGQNEFRFRVDTHGLVPQETEGNVIALLDPETGEQVYTFDQMDVKDAEFAQTGHYEDVSYENYYRMRPDPDGGADSRYILTAIIDKDFLEREDTVYPVTIDPTTQYFFNLVGDTSVYRGKTGNYSGASMNYVGYSPNDRAETYTLTQFDTGKLKYINVNKVSRACYKPYITGASAGWSVVLAVPSGYWTPSTVKFTDVNNGYRTLSTTYLSNTAQAQHEFDITGEFIKWLKADLGEQSDYDSRRGIMLMPGSNCPINSYRGIYSAESPSSMQPALVVEYTPDTSLAAGSYFIKNYACDRYLDADNRGTAEGAEALIYDFHGAENQRWIVERVSSSSEFYFIRSAYAPSLYLYADDAYASQARLSSTRMPWRIVRNSDGSYRIMPQQTERQALESASGNTDNCAPVKTWGFGNAPNQKWVFQSLHSIERMKYTENQGTFFWQILTDLGPVGISKRWSQTVSANYVYDPAQYGFRISKVTCFIKFDKFVDPNLGYSLSLKNTSIQINGVSYALYQDNNTLVSSEWKWDCDYAIVNKVIANGSLITAVSLSECKGMSREAKTNWNLYY